MKDDMTNVNKVLLIVLLVLLSIAVVSSLTARYTKAGEKLFDGDADRVYTSLTGLEDGLINTITLHYEWDEVYQGTSTQEVGMSASVR